MNESVNELNRVLPDSGLQTEVVASSASRLLVTGPRACGKTFGALLSWIKHQESFGPRAKGVAFVKQYSDLYHQAEEIFSGYGAKPDFYTSPWRFPSGAVFDLFRVIETTSNADIIKGTHPASFVLVDGFWPSGMFPDFAVSCCQPSQGVDPKIIICALDEDVTLKAVETMQYKFGFTHIHGGPSPNGPVTRSLR